MGLLLWGCKSATIEEQICTFSKSNATVPAVVQADTRGKNAVQPTKTWVALSPETHPDDAGSDVPTDDDAPIAGKALGPQWPSADFFFSETQVLGWRYRLAHLPPVRSAVTLPPPQGRA